MIKRILHKVLGGWPCWLTSSGYVDPDPKPPDIAHMAGVNRLYKYRPLGDQVVRSDGTSATQDVCDIIQNCRLFAATPAQLNDPLEFQLLPWMKARVSRIHLNSFVSLMTSSDVPPSLSQSIRYLVDETESFYDEYMAPPKPKVLPEILDEHLPILRDSILLTVEEHWRSHVRIVSLSERNDHLLMWSHYANGHRGVCLGFRAVPGNLFGKSMQVDYDGAMPMLELSRTHYGEMMRVASLSKGQAWNYEQEWRWLTTDPMDPEATCRYLTFTPDDLVEVIFGYRTPRQIQEAIREAASDRPHIRFGCVRQVWDSKGLHVEWDTPAPQLEGRARTENEKLVEQLRSEAAAFCEAGKHKKELQTLKVIEGLGESKETFSDKGAALYSLRRYGEALAACEQALDIDQKYSKAWYNKALALRRLGRTEEALVAYDRALDLEPTLARAWSDKGVSLDALGRVDEALVAHERAVTIDPSDALSWYNKGVVLSKLNRSKEALVDLERAVVLDPGLARAWYNKGVALCAIGLLGEGLECFDKALALDPNYSLASSSRKSLLKAMASDSPASTESKLLKLIRLLLGKAGDK